MPLTCTILGLLATNVLTLTSPAFNAALSGFMSAALGVRTVSSMLRAKIASLNTTIKKPSGLGRSGPGALRLDGQVVASRKMGKPVPMLLQWYESCDVGKDTCSLLNDEGYRTLFRFNGRLHTLTLTTGRPELSPQDIANLKMTMQRYSPNDRAREGESKE